MMILRGFYKRSRPLAGGELCGGSARFFFFSMRIFLSLLSQLFVFIIF